MGKLQSLEAAQFYANETLTKGWSRDLLLNAIKMDSYSQAQKQIKTHNLIIRFTRHMLNRPTKFLGALQSGLFGYYRTCQRAGIRKQAYRQDQILYIGIG
nr:hypothetical protein [Dyadobacter sp. 50-39]